MNNKKKVTIILILAICFLFIGYNIFKATFSTAATIYNQTIEETIISKSASNMISTSNGGQISELRSAIHWNSIVGDTHGYQDNTIYRYLYIKNYDYATYNTTNIIKSGIKKIANKYYTLNQKKELDICDVKLCISLKPVNNTSNISKELKIKTNEYKDLRLKFSYLYRGTDIEISRFNSAEIYVYVDNEYVGPFLIDDYETTTFVNRDASGADVYKKGNEGYVYNIVSENLLNNEKITNDSIITNILIVPYSRYDEYETNSSFNITELSVVGYKNGNYEKKTYEKMQVNENTIREKVVSNMIKNATLKWSPTEEFTYIENETKRFTFSATSSYYGLPYFDAIDTTRKSFLNQINSNGYIVPKDEHEEFAQEELRGLYCSSSVYEAVSESLPMHTDLGWTKAYLTSPEIKLLGNLTYNYGATGDSLNTSNVKEFYSEEEFYYAYSQLQIGDGIIHFTDYIEGGQCTEYNSVILEQTGNDNGYTYPNTLYNKGHVMIISGETVLMDSNGNKLKKYEVGKVDPNKSYVVATEITNNSGNTTNTYSIEYNTSFKSEPKSTELEESKYFNSKYTDLNSLTDIEGKYTQWNIHRKISFSDLYIGLQCSSYLPFTYTNYGNEIEKPYAILINGNTKNNINEGLKGTINTNYTIQEIKYTVTGYNRNSDGNYSYEHKTIATEYPDSTMIYSLSYQTNPNIKSEIISIIKNYDLYDINIVVKLGNKINDITTTYLEIEPEEIVIPIIKSGYYIEDMNLYQCIVDSYNSKNVQNINNSGRLSASQLSTIEEINCSNKNVISTQGIEKLTNITKLNLSNNQLTKLDLSSNIKLEELYLNKNKIEKINLNENQALSKLYIANNKLTELDLSNNLSLSEIQIYGNPYSETIYVYKGSSFDLGNNIKIPNSINYENPTWNSNDSNIIKVNNNETATALKSGSTNVIGILENKYSTTSEINVIEITSPKYTIDDEYIYTGTDNEHNIIESNINIPELIQKNINNDKLYLKYNEAIIKEFNIIYFSYNNIEIIDKIINIDNTLLYEEFINNIKISQNANYKIFNNNIEIKEGQILDQMIIKIYSDEKEIDTYKINIKQQEYHIEFDNTLNIDTNNKYIKSLKQDTTVSQILEKINLQGENTNIELIDKNGTKKTTTSIIATGDRVITYIGKEIKDEYIVSVTGDLNSDGKITVSDTAKLFQYYRNKIEMDEIYIEAGDIKQDKEIKLSDIAKLYQYVRGTISNL